VLLFGLCLFGDGYYIEGPNPRAWSPAWGLLAFGWLGVGAGGTAWLANPCLLLGWVALARRWKPVSIILAASALLLVISFLGVDRVIASEVPTYAHVVGYGIGYWLWLASAVALLGANLVDPPAKNLPVAPRQSDR
jgi:hypothetical protein